MTGKVPRRAKRLIAACYSCKRKKIRCSKGVPCQPCLASGRPDACEFPDKERLIPVPENYIDDLEVENKQLRALAIRTQRRIQAHGINPNLAENDDDDEAPPLSNEESNLFNPLFDRQPENWARERSAEPGFIGEASCAAFSNRLLSCLDDNYTPSTAGLSNYHRLNGYNRLMQQGWEFPERMHVKLLLNVAQQFIGNYHPLFLQVSFMKEIDAVYQKQVVPSMLWLCKFYSLMALGEIYTNRRGVGDINRVPGTNNYIRAVSLFQENFDSYEEPSLMQVEVLTLLAWASNIFGRIRTAYTYSGIATRLALSLGMHRSTPKTTTLTPVECESRRRTWWVLYFFDRFSASKLGQPLTVRDEDIDVEMPSMDGLTKEEMAEFQDPENLIINIKLGRIVGNILTQIYGIPKATKGRYIHQVHSILKQLRTWHEALPSDIRVRERGTPRPVASLHLAYNQCIIQTTRPVLLHLFKSQLDPRVREEEEGSTRPNISAVTMALAESCVHAAQASSRMVEYLFTDGSIATFGYWDAHHIFSAAMILIMSAMMKATAVNAEHLETLLSVLRALKNDGNIPAVDFCERLSHIQARVTALLATGRFGGDGVHPQRHQIPREMERPSHSQAPQQQIIQTPSSIQDGSAESAQQINFVDIDILGNPQIGDFLDGNQVQWGVDGLFTEDGTLREFPSAIDHQFNFVH